MRLLSKIAALILIGFMLGRVNNTTPCFAGQHNHITIERHIFGDAEDQSINFWRREVIRRFPDAYVVDCHGNDFHGVWCLYFEDAKMIVPAHDYAVYLRAKMPNRVIVFLACNPCGHDLGVPGVYHAMDSVWFVPDKDIPHVDTDQMIEQLHYVDSEPGVVGNVFEFTDQ